MAELPSAVPEVIDRLVAVAEALASDPFVQDGPPVKGVNQPKALIAIGWDADWEQLEPQSAEASQTYAYVGSTRQDEVGSVNGAVRVRTGDKQASIPRALAYALLNEFQVAVRVALRTDATLQSLLIHWGVSAGSLFQGQEDNGVYARVEFTVEFKAQI